MEILLLIIILISIYLVIKNLDILIIMTNYFKEEFLKLFRK